MFHELNLAHDAERVNFVAKHVWDLFNSKAGSSLGILDLAAK